jgi:hypothetical protein
MQHNHAPHMPELLNGLDSGQNTQSTAFQNTNHDFGPHLALPNGGDLACVGCCWTYLVGTRGYAQASGIIRVYFGIPTVSCFVDGPQGPAGKHAVIQTGHDLNLGVVGNRPTQQSRSFQLYSPVGGNMRTIAIGAPISAQIESISINQLSSVIQLNGCYFKYCNAALIEPPQLH